MEKLRKEVEQLKRRNQFLEKVIDAIPDPIFVKNIEHENILANQAFLNLVEKKQNEVLNQLDENFLPQDSAKICYEQDQKAILNDHTVENEEILKDLKGNLRNILTKRTICKINKNEKYLVGAIRDITQFRQMERELFEKTRLASIGEVAAKMAHEINNPLLIVQVKAHLAYQNLISEKKDYDQERLLKDLQAIEVNSIRIAEIVRSLSELIEHQDEF